MYWPVIASCGVLKPINAPVSVSQSVNRRGGSTRARLGALEAAKARELTESNLFVVSNAGGSFLADELLGGKEHALLLLESLLSL